jgi:hypothetical protein
MERSAADATNKKAGFLSDFCKVVTGGPRFTPLKGDRLFSA